VGITAGRPGARRRSHLRKADSATSGPQTRPMGDSSASEGESEWPTGDVELVRALVGSSSHGSWIPTTGARMKEQGVGGGEPVSVCRLQGAARCRPGPPRLSLAHVVRQLRGHAREALGHARERARTYSLAFASSLLGTHGDKHQRRGLPASVLMISTVIVLVITVLITYSTLYYCVLCTVFSLQGLQYCVKCTGICLRTYGEKRSSAAA